MKNLKIVLGVFPVQSCCLCSSSFDQPKSARSYTLFVTAVTDGMMAPALEARQEDSRFKPSASVDSCLHRFQTH